VQQAFGRQVTRWYEIRNETFETAKDTSLTQRYIKKAAEYAQSLSLQKLAKTPAKLTRKILSKLSESEYRKHERRLQEARSKVIEPELTALLETAHLEPQVVENPNSLEFVHELKSRRPTFLLTLGGPLYCSEIINAPSGLAINQHAGWSPHYKGSGTVYWALYHRDVRRLGSTVHVLSEGADAGPILARSFPALTGEESPEECFLRVVVLGTELMIDAVKKLCTEGGIMAYEQPSHVGRTYTSADMDEDSFRTLRHDAERGVLAELIERSAAY
jgi:methionyl-tRNA formyltransferase